MKEMKTVFSSDSVWSENNFDRFVEGDCNRLARSFGLAIAENPGGSLLNPLVICAGPGSGKTFLAQAIYHKIQSNNPNNQVVYMNSATFCKEYCDAVRKNRSRSFSKIFSKQDSLILDDVCYLVGKTKTQEVLARFIIDQYLFSHKQVVLTSSVFPTDYGKFEPRFASLLLRGVAVFLTKPSYETRLIIVKNSLKSLGMQLADNVIEHLALKIDKPIQVLENAIVVVLASASMMNCTIDINFVDSTLNKFLEQC